MAHKKIKPNKLDIAITELLDAYKDEVGKDLAGAFNKVVKAGVSDLKSASRATFGGTGKYASSWTFATEEERVLKQKHIIYSKTPGLPHLLEHGHALRGGGRSGSVQGREHIAPIERKIIEAFEKELINEIQ